MTRLRWAQSCAALMLFLLGGSALAQQLIVGAGARLVLGNAVVDAGCRDVDVAGTIEMGGGSLLNVRDINGTGGSVLGGTGTLSLSGDLALAAALRPQGGSVRIVDGCGRAQARVLGNHQLNRFSVVSSGRTVIFPAGGTQTIASALELLGGAQRLILRSSVVGTVSYLALAAAGTQLIDRVDAQDVGAPDNAQFLAPNPPEFYDSIDRGNTPRFFGDIVFAPVPTQTLPGLLLMLLLMAAVAVVQLRSYSQGDR